MRVLGRLAAAHGDTTDFVAFGGSAEEMQSAGIPEYDGVTQLGVLAQPAMAALLQQADIFLDL